MSQQPLSTLGWKPWFSQQLSTTEAEHLVAMRVGAHFGSQVLCLTPGEEFCLPSPLIESCGDLAVGDWFLLDPRSRRGVRRLERESLIARKAAGSNARTQLIAANVDTLFIVSSCNHDFNPARLERYLAVASEAEVTPVVILTKADLCDSPETYRHQASRLMSNLTVETINARESLQPHPLAPWCTTGQTVALVGSSGVGKSTLASSMGAGHLRTQGIREDDAKGRHTTTTRSIHQLDAGGLLIDTPGMRELQLTECEQGVDEVFDEITELAAACRFRDCSHDGEPGCAVRSAIEQEQLDETRLTRFRKLKSEQARNTRTLREQRHQSKKQGQFYKSVIAEKRDRRRSDY